MPHPLRPRPRPAAGLLLTGLLLLATSACKERTSATAVAAEPAQAVGLLARHLRNNDLQAFAHDAVPPELRPQLAEAWRAGRTRWPLEELPFDRKIPGMLQTLAANNADATLRRSFERQFANANTEIKAAAGALGLFGVKYLQSDDTLSVEERAHYTQLLTALSEWAGTAKLGDPKRGRAMIARLTQAARDSGLRDEADFQRFGMDESLRRLRPMSAALKEGLRAYGLDLDQSLDAMQVSLEQQTGDTARVRMRYPLAGKPIDTVIAVERIDGHWYLSDFVRHARAAVEPLPEPPPAPQETAPAAAPAKRATAKPSSS